MGVDDVRSCDWLVRKRIAHSKTCYWWVRKGTTHSQQCGWLVRKGTAHPQPCDWLVPQGPSTSSHVIGSCTKGPPACGHVIGTSEPFTIQRKFFTILVPIPMCEWPRNANTAHVFNHNTWAEHAQAEERFFC
ncbi:hypothetical protein Aduo_000670 [Ancylostoma duodenale]